MINSTGDWTTQPKAEQLLKQTLEDAYASCPDAKLFTDRLLEDVAIRMRDIVDHIKFGEPTKTVDLMISGWTSDDEIVFRNTTGFFPAFVLGKRNEVHFRVENIEDFARANHLQLKIEGKPGSPLRKALAFKGTDADFWVIERHGTDYFEIDEIPDTQIRLARVHLQSFRSRRREFDQVQQGFDHTDRLVDKAVEDIGAHWACSLFLQAEREYWMQRNRAGRLQKERQDKLGIGWANQDHHTFDSSRQHFHRTVRILEKLGFECRELFYAGAGAGWGSQILEQPVLNAVIFADIDLAPEELDIDFAHNDNLEPLYPMRRAGLWCAMHGESMLEAGLNHLECMYDSARLNEQFAAANIEMMAPFSDFPHLYQALTVGEWWPVDPAKIDQLEKEGHIDPEAAEDFRLHGAIGSHFENLERNDGFKGFNQPGIDDVLKIIDPRQQLQSTTA